MPGTANSGGRNRKSAQQHQLEGTYQRVRHDGSKAPEPPKGTPEPPCELSGLALDEWNRMVSRLSQSKSLAVVDDAAIFQYAKLFAETEDLAEAQLRTDQLIDRCQDAMGDLEGSDLTEAIREVAKLSALSAGYSTKVRQGRMAIRAYLVEFGMTPAARSRVKLPEDSGKDNDPFAEFDGGPVN